MTKTDQKPLSEMFKERYGEDKYTACDAPEYEPLYKMAQRGSCRDFQQTPITAEVLQVLCATAFASPTKSDLQQRDIVVLQSPAQRKRLAEIVSGQRWVTDAPMIIIFCGNNRRQRLLHDWHGIPFANDHLDAFFNAAADAAIALGAFVTAAEAMGLGCCPISAVRNDARAVADLLHLPDHVFPMAGLAVGYPSHPSAISHRLPLAVTCHVDHYQEDGLQDAVQEYDKRRAEAQPYASQRFVEDFGASDAYTWSQDKARQYSKPERDGFGAYVRSIGYRLE